MTCEEVKALLADDWAGTLAGAEEIGYALHLESCTDCRAERARLDRIWKALAELPSEEPGRGLRERFFGVLGAYGQGLAARSQGARWPVKRLVGIAAALLAGIGLGYGLRAVEPGGDVAKLRGEVADMRQLVTLSLLQQQSASERLRGVSWAYRTEPTSGEVLDALVTAMNHDTNVNVRLAAVDALHAFSEAPVTRRAVVESLPRQETPLVQVALIDLLVDFKEKNAAGALRNLAQTASVNDGVKQRALWALERLQ